MQKTILALLIVMCTALQVQELQQANKQFDKLSQDSPVGKFLMDLAQIHAEVQGPLDDLKETIEKFYENLQESISQLDGEFQSKQAIHLKVLQNYESNQQDAQIDIAQSQDQLDNVLSRNKENIEKRLKQIQQNINDNRSNIQRDKLQRNQQKDQNVEHIHEHQQATTSIDEALSLVQGLSSGNIAFVEAPMKKTLDYIKQKVNSREEYAPLVDALISLSGTQDTKQIKELLNKLRNQIVDSMIQLTSDENDAQKMFDDRQKQLDSEFQEFQTQVNQATYDLASISARIDQEKEFTKQRQSDLDMYNSQIEMENNNFAAITGLYNEIRSVRLKELKVAEDAKNFAYSSQFRELLQSKLNK
ncbi:unnamed protein product [Paramecium primaurelia]|uniref:Uncharacterized protein n=2 Tax=Paramecium TaxID=5884 RepID=A0A8S1VZY6_9CILI|nr:unnamed protein product [Paramecium primaurelia]CAD8181422.1 unnamed protein product [Paramecium pentaurelia]